MSTKKLYVACVTIIFLFFMPVPVEAVTLQSVRIQSSKTTSLIGKGSVGMSALAYDENNQPIWTGVTYEWGVSSGSSIGSVNPLYGTITNFTPLNPGTGDVFVVARMGTQYQSAGIQMTVIRDVPGDTNDDGKVNLSDLSMLLAHFGSLKATRIEGDVNGDGKVYLEDLSLLLSNFGK